MMKTEKLFGIDSYVRTAMFLCLLSTSAAAQDNDNSLQALREAEMANYMAMAEASQTLNTDNNIDITFYHISLSVTPASQTIGGSVYVELLSTINNLNQVKLNLHNSMTVSAVSENAAGWSRYSSNTITLALDRTYYNGETVKLRIDYSGTPVSPNGYKGFRFFPNSNNFPVAVTLSTPYLAHYWFPCKDGPTDKADSVYVDITTPTTYGGATMKGISNGILTGTTTSGSYTTFKWKHRHACVPYYVMVAVGRYDTINQTYNNNGHNFPLEYFVFPSDVAAATTGVSIMPQAFDAFIHYFGDYPFKDEKYGMTQIGFYGGIENQTNSIMNSMNSSWRETMVHELAHMWFGCAVTCTDWHHVWINEGFASYAEALYYEYTQGMTAYRNHMNTMQDASAATIAGTSAGTVFLSDDSDPFSVFTTVAYDKGAWVLHMLRGVLGDEVFFNCIKTFAQDPAFRFKNASTEDLEELCEGISGKDLSNFFDQWIYNKGYPMYAFNFYSDTDEGKTGLTILQWQVDNRNWPLFEMPLRVRFTFQDGTTRTETIQNSQKVQTYYFDFTKTVTAVAIDPDSWVLRYTESTPYTAIVVPRAPSGKKQITGFTIAGQVGTSTINQTEKTITAVMPLGTNLTSLAPIITISAKAGISPASGITRDFSLPVVYRVTAEDGTFQDYTVTITNQKNTEKQILGFDIAGQLDVTVIDQPAKTVSITMPYGTDRNGLAPVIVVSAAASVDPASGQEVDFTLPVQYTVTAEDGSSQIYTVVVTNALNSEKQILSFTITGQAGMTEIDQSSRTVTVTMPAGSVITALAPVLTVSQGATVSPASGETRDFTTAQSYSVTSQDGTSQTYSVTITILPSPDISFIDVALCEGGTVEYSTQANPLNQYRWTVTGGTIVPEDATLWRTATMGGNTVSVEWNNHGNGSVLVEERVGTSVNSATDQISVTVHKSIDEKLITALAPVIYEGESTHIVVPGSQIGTVYQLRNVSAGADIGGTLTGTGSDLYLSTGNLSYTSGGIIFGVTASNGGCTLAMHEQPLVAFHPDYVWSGAINNNWNNHQNWQRGVAPLPSDNVMVKGSTHNPEISDDVTINHLGIQSGASLTFRSGARVTVNGDILNDGASIIVENTIDNPVSFLTWGTISAPVTVRWIYPNGRYMYVGHGVNGVTYASYDGVTANPFNLYRYTGAAWSAISSGSGATGLNGEENALEGYTVKFGETDDVAVFYTGTLRQGDYSRSINGWNLVANPYLAYLDLASSHLFLDNSLSTIWTTTNASGSTIYATYNIASNIGANGGTRYIAPGQSFWVRNYAPGVLTIHNLVRTHAAGSLKSASSSTDVLRLSLGNAMVEDENVLAFREIGSDGYSLVYDSEKRFSTGTGEVSLYSKKEGKNLIINVLPSDMTGRVIPLAINIGSGTVGPFTFTATNINQFGSADNVILTDLVTGESIDLRKTPRYVFTSGAVSSQNRFELSFKAIDKAPGISTGVDGNTTSGIDIVAVGIGNKAIVKVKDLAFAGKVAIEVVDAFGRLQKSISANTDRIEFDSPSNTQFYVVKVTYKNMVRSFKIINGTVD
ncbi:MAG: M1 family aminopeptidase [Breznakibacter sp.]